MIRTTVGELMTREVVTLSQEQAVPAAQELIRMLHIRHLPVVSSEGTLVGLVTQRQLLAAHALLLEQLGSKSGTDLELTIPVSKVMETEVQTVVPGTLAVEALELMLDRKIGCLPIVEGGKVIGIITTRDFLTFEAKKLRSEQEAAPAPAPAPVRFASWTLAPAVLLILAMAGFLVYREVTRPTDGPPVKAQAAPDGLVAPRLVYQHPPAVAERGVRVDAAVSKAQPRAQPRRDPVPAKVGSEADRSDARKTETRKAEAKKTETRKVEPKRTEAPEKKKEQPWIPEPIPKAW